MATEELTTSKVIENSLLITMKAKFNEIFAFQTNNSKQIINNATVDPQPFYEKLEFSPELQEVDIKIALSEKELKQLKLKQKELEAKECQDEITKRGIFWQLEYTYPNLMLPFILIRYGYAYFETPSVLFHVRAGVDDGTKNRYRIYCRIPLSHSMFNQSKGFTIANGIKAWDFKYEIQFDYLETIREPRGAFFA